MVREQGTSDFELGLWIFLGICALYVFAVTWPMSLVLGIALILWWFTREGSSPLSEAVHRAASPVLVGIGLFWFVVLLARVGEPDNPWLFSRPQLFAAEQTLL